MATTPLTSKIHLAMNKSQSTLELPCDSLSQSSVHNEGSGVNNSWPWPKCEIVIWENIPNHMTSITEIILCIFFTKLYF